MEVNFEFNVAMHLGSELSYQGLSANETLTSLHYPYHRKKSWLLDRIFGRISSKN